MSAKIRKMSQKDIRIVIAAGSKEKNFSAAPKSEGFWSKEQLTRSIEQNDNVLLVAEKNDEIVGFAIAFVHKPTGKATFENLWIHPGARKEGLGSALIKKLMRQLKNKGCISVCGLTKENNNPMLQLFEKMGFEKGDKFYWINKKL